MTPYRTIITALLLAAVLCIPQLMSATDAGAARVGGGKSFGGSSSYSRPVPAPAAPKTAQPAPGRQGYSQQQQQPGMGASAPRSGFGGLMGGLLAGSLLGALFFGGPYSGFGVTDILLFAVLAFAGLKLLRVLRNRGQQPASAAGGRPQSAAPDAHAAQRPDNDPWQRMRSTSQNGPGGFGIPPDSRGQDERRGGGPMPGGPLPPNFDQGDFLRGAKMAFTRLQESWDKRDLDDIARFSTEAILREVREQAKADPRPSRTDVLLVNASLLSVKNEGRDEVASVYFDVLLREDPKAEAPTQVREIWHFTRPAGGKESWKLDGIQQVES